MNDWEIAQIEREMERWPARSPRPTDYERLDAALTRLGLELRKATDPVFHAINIAHAWVGRHIRRWRRR